ncbi:hypothetical protein H4R18_002618 [Coemansia javaensis]|uniref:ENTH domain-containing protein n=1 Tax=Coemansia javaensis TaxID=2761396 RepID=A0A9W8LJL8_9FUNG|nr:hypothetical protein H4R18_002618 [Coemansia javaensis]
MSAKGVLRTVKNYTLGCTPIQMKVLSATSNEPGAPSLALMSEIAQATYNQTDFLGIMDIIDKRMNDKGRLWRHVYKALVLLDYLLRAGAPYVVEYSIDNLFIVKTLREFQHIDKSGLDQGANVREKAKALTALLSDRSRLEAERKSGNWMGGRPGFGGHPGGHPGGHYNGHYASSSSRLQNSSGGGGGGSGGRPSHRRGESLSASSHRRDDDGRSARRAQAPIRQVPSGYDEEAALKHALEESAREAKEKEDLDKAVVVAAAPKETDLLGGFDDASSTALVNANANVNANSIGLLDNINNNNNNNSAISFSHQQQQQQQQFAASSVTNDLLGAFGAGPGAASSQFMTMSSMTTSTTINSTGNTLGGVGNMGGMNNLGTMNSMGGMSSMGGTNSMGGFDPFGLANSGGGADAGGMGLVSGMNAMAIGASSGINHPGLSAPMGFGTPAATSTPGPFDSTNTSQFLAQSTMTASVAESSVGGAAAANPFGQQQQQSGGFGGASGAFSNAFDGGAGAKALPFAGANDANARIAEIARNSDKIDPFASLAMESSSNPFGAAPGAGAGSSSGMGMSAALTSQGLGTGGSSLVDFSSVSQATSTNMSSQQTFGQPNRNPFAAGDGGSGIGGAGNRQPSLNQLMSSAGPGSSLVAASTPASTASLFGQQSAGGALSGLGAESQLLSFQQQQPQPQQPLGGMGAFSNISAESQTKSFQQQQGTTPMGTFSSMAAESQQSSFHQQQQQGFGQQFQPGLGQQFQQQPNFGQQFQQQQPLNPFAQQGSAGAAGGGQANFFGL